MPGLKFSQFDNAPAGPPAPTSNTKTDALKFSQFAPPPAPKPQPAPAAPQNTAKKSLLDEAGGFIKQAENGLFNVGKNIAKSKPFQAMTNTLGDIGKGAENMGESLFGKSQQKPEAKSMTFPVGAGIDNKVNILPGPRKDPMQGISGYFAAKERGDNPTMKPGAPDNPISEKDAAKAHVQESILKEVHLGEDVKKYVKENNPSDVGFLGTLTHTFYPTKALKTADDPYAKRATDEILGEYQQQHPWKAMVASTIGGLANLMLLGKAGVGGLGEKAGEEAAGTMSPTMLRIMKSFASNVPIFATQSAIDETFKQTGEGKYDAGEFVKSVGEGALFSAPFGLSAGIYNKVARAGSVAAMSSGLVAVESLLKTKKIDGKDLSSVISNGLMNGFFELLGEGKNSMLAEDHQRDNNISRDALKKDLVENKKIPEAIAENVLKATYDVGYQQMKGSNKVSDITTIVKKSKAELQNVPAEKMGEIKIKVAEKLAQGEQIADAISQAKAEISPIKLTEKFDTNKPESPEYKQAEHESTILAELGGAEKGQRIFIRDNDKSLSQVTGQKSTFPQWIPKNLRLKSLIEPVLEHIQNGTVPTKAKEARLYNVIADEISSFKKDEPIINKEINVDEINFNNPEHEAKIDNDIKDTYKELQKYEQTTTPKKQAESAVKNKKEISKQKQKVETIDVENLNKMDKANYDLTNKIPKQKPDTIRVYQTGGINTDGVIKKGTYVDTSLKEHISRGLATENKTYQDIPKAEFDKLFSPVDDLKTKAGIYKASADTQGIRYDDVAEEAPERKVADKNEKVVEDKKASITPEGVIEKPTEKSEKQPTVRDQKKKIKEIKKQKQEITKANDADIAKLEKERAELQASISEGGLGFKENMRMIDIDKELRAKKEAQIVLKMEIIPGLSSFVSRDVAPPVKTLLKSMEDTLHPGGNSESAKLTRAGLRKAKAEIINKEVLERMRNRKTENHFNKFSAEENILSISNYEKTGKFLNEPTKGYSEFYKKSTDESHKLRALAYGNDKAAYVENYVMRMFKFGSKDAEEAGRSFLGSKSLSASKAPTKQRVLDMPLNEALADMKKRGIDVKMVSTNPEIIRQWDIANARQAYIYSKMWDGYKDNGLLRYVPTGSRKIPEGWQRLDDRVTKVWKSPEIPIKEAFDQHVMNGLNDVAANLGIDNKRMAKIGGRGRWGYATSDGKVRTKFGGPESVLAHEIGHEIDFKYGLQKQLEEAGKKLVAEGYDQNPITGELRNLADLRYEGKTPPDSFKKYVRKGGEKMAVMMEAYIHAPEKFKKVAPNVYDTFTNILESDPKLAPLMDISPSLVLGTGDTTVHAGGAVKAGEYFAPPEVKKILDNAISDGFGGSPTMQGLRKISNTLNQMQLGFSGFHAMGSAFNAGLSELGLVAPKLAQGKVVSAVGSAIKGTVFPLAAISDLYNGGKFINGLLANDPEAMKILNEKLVPAGGRISQERLYYDKLSERMKTEWKEGNYWGAVLRMPGAIVEQASVPLMNYAIPRVKLGAFLKLADVEMGKLAPDANETIRARAYARAWDSIDNRFGQLVYDNLFWDKMTKDIFMTATRSAGWNLGTIREIGGGVKDIFDKTLTTRGQDVLFDKNGKAKREVTARTQYTLGLVLYTGLVGGITNYLLTGKAPKELKDYYYPKDGSLNANGDPNRISFPTYAKDIYSYYNDPVATIEHKASPGVAMAIELLNNTDFYGNLIRNPNDPKLEQAAQLGKYLLSQYLPFSATQTLHNTGQGQSIGKALLPFIGLTPAPGSIVDTDFTKQVKRLYQDQMGTKGAMTPEQQEISLLKAQARQEIKDGVAPGKSSALVKLVQSGNIKSKKSLQSFLSGSKLSTRDRMIKSLSKDNKLKLLQWLQAQKKNKK